eukprot:4333969-Lingulodinium_polyedra.AAC.1
MLLSICKSQAQSRNQRNAQFKKSQPRKSKTRSAIKICRQKAALEGATSMATGWPVWTNASPT